MEVNSDNLVRDSSAADSYDIAQVNIWSIMAWGLPFIPKARPCRRIVGGLKKGQRSEETQHLRDQIVTLLAVKPYAVRELVGLCTFIGELRPAKKTQKMRNTLNGMRNIVACEGQGSKSAWRLL